MKLKIFLKSCFFCFLLVNLFFVQNLFSQEGDSIQIIRQKVIMGPREIPYDTMPSDAYLTMYNQKMTLRGLQGFEKPFFYWSSLGPKPINDWGTSAGRVSCVAFDPRDGSGNTIWIGGANGGVWWTTDGGQTWMPRTDNQPTLACGSIAIDPNWSGQNSIIYVGTGEGIWFGGSPYSGNGVLKSTHEEICPQKSVDSFFGPGTPLYFFAFV